jgi:tripartite-type tricarboxylate transporter receptor subunit TctC
MLTRLLVMIVALAAASAGFAQSFPTRPVTLICPWPAGGASDVVLRAMAESAGRVLGQPVVVENRPGASGTLGAVAMMNARPDGYTVTQAPITVFRLPLIQKTPFDPFKDLTYIVNLTGYTFGLVVRADAPWQTLRDLVAHAKANPGKITYGTPGANTTPYLAIEEFAQKAGIKLTHVPFRGAAENLQSLLGGHTDAMSDSTSWAPHVESGKLRLLAVYGSQRAKRFANAPTLKELGFDTVSDSPFGIAGPRGMDPQALRTLHDAFKKTLEDPKVLKTLEQFDQPVIYMGPDEYTAWGKATFEQERATFERLGIKPQ